jgi:hypothetical protein
MCEGPGIATANAVHVASVLESQSEHLPNMNLRGRTAERAMLPSLLMLEFASIQWRNQIL